MQKQDYAGLSRTFDAYYPNVKQLVEETELFYQSSRLKWHLDETTVRFIGTFTVNNNDKDATLPRLYFKKEAEKANPYFYVISTMEPDSFERIIHIGTSVETASPNSCSVSALTGGGVPNIEKFRTYSTYLKIMSSVRKNGYCNVYEIPTGYENINIKGVNGLTIAKEAFAKQIFNFINCDRSGNRFNDDFLLSQEERAKKENQNVRDNKIWDSVVAFKTMVNTKPEVLDAMAKLSEPAKEKHNDDQQEITVGQNGINITFRFKNRVLPISSEEYKIKKDNELDKFIPTSAKILCQVGDTVIDKYTSYVTRKLKAGETINNDVEKKFAKLQKKLIAFEDFIGSISNGEKRIEYGNIYLGDVTHAVNGKCHTFNDGTDSRISITLTEAPTLERIKLIADIIKDLFDLDPKTKVILAS